MTYIIFNNPYFDILGQIYSTKQQLNEENSADTEAQFSDLDLSITNVIVPPKKYYKQYDFDFEIVNSHFLMEIFLATFLWCIYFTTYSFC